MVLYFAFLIVFTRNPDSLQLIRLSTADQTVLNQKKDWTSQDGAVILEQPGWSSQTGAARMKQSDWSRKDEAVRLEQKG